MDGTAPARCAERRPQAGLLTTRGRVVRGAAVGALAALASTGHIIYPVVLYAWTRRLGDPVPPESSAWPDVTVVVPAYREEAVIGRKVEDTLANGYPGRLEVLVVADDAMTAKAAADTDARVLEAVDRTGKADSVNRGVDAAGGQVIVLTDANTLLAPGAVCALARWFEDPAVGAVVGEKVVLGESESAYWRFESWLKRLESRTGTTVALLGELNAIRKEGFEPLPTDLAVEDLWLGLDVIERGDRIVYDPSARASEAPTPRGRDDWERRTRVVAGAIDVLWRRRRLLMPSHGVVAIQLWGHKAVRSSVGPLAHFALLLLAVRRTRRSRLAAGAVASHLVGAAAVIRSQRGVHQSRVERLVAQGLWLQAVGLGGTLRYVRGDRPALWPKPVRVAPPASL